MFLQVLRFCEAWPKFDRDLCELMAENSRVLWLVVILFLVIKLVLLLLLF